MRYTIVTPTICRPSLLRLCGTIDSQTQSDWEHLVVIDMPRDHMNENQRKIMASIPSDQRRSYFYCAKRHNNYGHTCRHQAWEQAQGDYLLYVDDDDYLADEGVLKALDSVVEPWAVFPILRHGQVFLDLPPGMFKTGTGMFIHQKKTGRWPDSDSYEADGLFIEKLKKNYSYQVVDSRPIVVQPASSYGLANVQTWRGDKFAKLIKRWHRYRYYGRALLSRYTSSADVKRS